MIPIISIIVPVYNVKDYLFQCVESILHQSFNDFEIIIIDDGSFDESAQFSDSYSYGNHRVTVIHKSNGGLSSARLSGFRIAKGAYCLFLDSDDWIEPSMIESLYNAIRVNDSDLSICGYAVRKNDSNKYHYISPQLSARNYIESLLTGKVPGYLWIRLMKTNLISEDFFKPEQLYYAEDIVFDLLYAQRVSKIAVVEKCLYNYRINDQSLTMRYRENKWEMFYNLYCFKRDYCLEHDIQNCDYALNSALGTILFVGIDNAVRTGSYKAYLEELGMNLEKREYPFVLNATKKMKVTRLQRMILFLTEHRLFLPLYLVRKMRLK